MSAYGPYLAEVTHIHDGDTFGCEIDLASLVPANGIDLGFNIKFIPSATITLNCRIYSINAPELSTQAGKDALAFMETLLAVGDSITVTVFGWDKYGGRFDGRVFLADGTNLGATMVASGHAVVMAPGTP